MAIVLTAPMNADQTKREPLAHAETTSRIIGAAYEVHQILGYGFLEKVYQRAMQVELIKRRKQRGDGNID